MSEQSSYIAELAGDIKAGMNRSALELKYGLSRQSLRELCGQAMQLGLVDRNELEALSLLPEEVSCPQCNWPNLPSNRFCTECGASLKDDIYPTDDDRFIDRRLLTLGMALITLLSVKYVDPVIQTLTLSSFTSCLVITVYFVILVAIFYAELHGIRSAIRRLMCDTYFQEGRLFYWFCKRRTVTRLFSVVGAGILGVSLLLFIYLADAVTVGILFLDIFIFVWWRRNVPNIITEQLTDKAGRIVVQIFLIGINVAFLFILFLTAWGIETYAFTPEVANPFEHPDKIAETVVAEIKHSCYIFRTIARFGYAFSLTVEGLQTLPGLGKWLYPLFYLTNLSLLPFIGITLLYSRFYSRR